MNSFDVCIVGGGIAGMSTAWHLVRQGVPRVCVLEREWACGTQATGTNAAIFRHFETHASAVRLAVRSRVLLDDLGVHEQLLHQTGAVYFGPPATLERAMAALEEVGVPFERVTAEQARRRWPLLVVEEAGLFLPLDGVLDVHGVMVGLLSALRTAGASVRTHSEVVGIERQGERFGVKLSTGEVMTAGRLVLAGGAWSAGLGELVGASLPLTPLRRHLAQLEVHTRVAPGHPIVWRLDDEVYFRPESGGVLASPCDETRWPAGPVRTSPQEVAKLAEKLPGLAPALGDSGVRTSWAGLRTFAPDRDFVVGGDPRAPGVTWIAGLGGRGMTCGLALGELAAAAVREAAPPELQEFRPARLAAAG